MAGYHMNFNQDFTSITMLNSTGFRLFAISANDRIDEIFSEDNEHIRIVERLFNSSLMVLVTVRKPNCLKMLHFKKQQDICNCVYPSEILCVRMNRHRLIVCLAESMHIHDIRDMKILHSIRNITPNELGLCTLSLNSHLALPICSSSGELRIFDANKLKPGLTIKAHDTPLAAMCFSPDDTLLATASERGTIIRVFCVKSGQRVQEFRRGVKRCVRIASMVFSVNGDFLCVSSNTETVHIFKIDAKAVEPSITEGQSKKRAPTTPTKTKGAARTPAAPKAEETPNALASTVSSGWSGYLSLSKAVSSYLIPSQVCDVLAQDRAFATAVLAQPGLRHVCGLACVEKELKLLIACEDGFLYIYEFNAERGGQCKLQRVHDLRCPLEGVIELNLNDSMDKMPLPNSTTIAPNTPTVDATDAAVHTTTTTTTVASTEPISESCSMSSVVIENPDPAPDNSYAGILKGEQKASALTGISSIEALRTLVHTLVRRAAISAGGDCRQRLTPAQGRRCDAVDFAHRLMGVTKA